MYPRYHIILGFLFSLLLIIIFPIGIAGFLLVFLSSFLIDFDHFMIYYFYCRKLSLKSTYKWYNKIDEKVKLLKKKSKKCKAPLDIFHTIEFIFLVFLLSLYSKFFLFILIGMIFHSLLDIIDMYKRKVLFVREYSIIHFLMKRNKKEYKIVK